MALLRCHVHLVLWLMVSSGHARRARRPDDFVGVATGRGDEGGSDIALPESSSLAQSAQHTQHTQAATSFWDWLRGLWPFGKLSTENIVRELQRSRQEQDAASQQFTEEVERLKQSRQEQEAASQHFTEEVVQRLKQSEEMKEWVKEQMTGPRLMQSWQEQEAASQHFTEEVVQKLKQSEEMKVWVKEQVTEPPAKRHPSGQPPPPPKKHAMAKMEAKPFQREKLREPSPSSGGGLMKELEAKMAEKRKQVDATAQSWEGVGLVKV